MNFATFRKLTRIEQSLFGLPFILAAALLPFITDSVALQFQFKWLWVLPAFFAARISGMSFNQVIDHKIDAENPRTKMRVVASGALQSTLAYTIAFASLLFFLFCCGQINVPTFYLALCASFFLFVYSYAKRYTFLCHFILGTIHFLGPLMAWVAITGTISLPAILLACANMSLIVGGDIIYALQDVEFDTVKGLCSIPVTLGIEGSRFVAQAMHALCWLSLFLLAISASFSFLFYVALLFIGLNFVRFHARVGKKIEEDRSCKGIESLFFYCTITVSLSTLLFIILEWAIKR